MADSGPVEAVDFCGCTNEELETGRRCDQSTCPNNDLNLPMYNIVRFFRFSDLAGSRTQIVKRNVTLAEAQDHCGDPETSSSTATGKAALRRTSSVGPWFDGYEEA